MRTALISRVLKLCPEKQLGIAIQRMSTILWLHHDTMKFVNLDESWSFKTKISVSDPQFYLGSFPFLWLFVSCFSKNIVEGQLRMWKPGMKLRSKKTQKNKNQTREYDIASSWSPRKGLRKSTLRPWLDSRSHSWTLAISKRATSAVSELLSWTMNRKVTLQETLTPAGKKPSLPCPKSPKKPCAWMLGLQNSCKKKGHRRSKGSHCTFKGLFLQGELHS